MFDVECTVVGGGVVGCAVADVAAGMGLSTVLIEMDDGLGRATTSRNSEVAHGGMYYPTGSLKAACCVAGRRQLKVFCAEAGVAYREYGKLIVAIADDELPELERLLTLGQANGVEDLRLVDGNELRTMEPEIAALAGLFSPRTGVLDAEGAAKAYARRAAERGAQILTGARVAGLDPEAGGWRVGIEPSGRGRAEGWRHTSRFVVNAAGLWADRVAALAGVDVDGRAWRLHLTKGNYFAVDSAHAGRLRHLVYPVPPADRTSLGVHVCLDLGGQMKLGPDVEAPAEDPRVVADRAGGTALDYRVDPDRDLAFWNDARRFLPWLRREDLVPSMCGLRPKLVPTGFADFVVRREDGDLAGLVNLVGIESPGLTSAPALAGEVARLLTEAVEA